MGGDGQAAKQALLAAIPNAKSDHLVVVVAFDAWARTLASRGRAAAAAFCSDNFISHQVRCYAPATTRICCISYTLLKTQVLSTPFCSCPLLMVMDEEGAARGKVCGALICRQWTR